jgi:ribonuclease P/MRP protein subunit POP3
VPPAPELAGQIDFGLASISRYLESLSAKTATELLEPRPEESPDASQTPYSAVFVLRSQHPAAFHSHFPQLISTASQHLPSDRSIRLIGFSKACEDKLSDCLGIPRVSSVALRTDLPQAKAVIEFVREHVPPVDAGWHQEARSGKFLATKINAIETKVGAKKQRRV